MDLSKVPKCSYKIFFNVATSIGSSFKRLARVMLLATYDDILLLILNIYFTLKDIFILVSSKVLSTGPYRYIVPTVLISTNKILYI